MIEILLGFLKIGATGYGGPAIIGVMQAEFQERRQWTSKPRFLEGLALVIAAAASFLPSFVMMLALLPAFDRIRNLMWARAVIQAIVPAVIGVMAVVLVRIAPHAAPDAPAIVALIVATAVLLLWRVAPLKAMAGGAVFGIIRDRVWAR